MLGQVDIARQYASVERRRFSAIDRMFGDWPTIIIGDCTYKSPLGWVQEMKESFVEMKIQEEMKVLRNELEMSVAPMSR